MLVGTHGSMNKNLRFSSDPQNPDSTNSAGDVGGLTAPNPAAERTTLLRQDALTGGHVLERVQQKAAKLAQEALASRVDLTAYIFTTVEFLQMNLHRSETTTGILSR